MSTKDSTVDLIDLLVDSDRQAEALELLEEYISLYPRDEYGYRRKAYVLAIAKDYQGSLAATEKLLELDTSEPRDFFELAQKAVILGRNIDAVRWADRGIELCSIHSWFYYFEACHFEKAVALASMHDYEGALEAVSVLEAGYCFWVAGRGLVTKEDILAQCNLELERMRRKRTRWTFDDDSD